jgi:hypothetical protein
MPGRIIDNSTLLLPVLFSKSNITNLITCSGDLQCSTRLSLSIKLKIIVKSEFGFSQTFFLVPLMLKLGVCL